MCANENGSGRPSIGFLQLVGDLARDKVRREQNAAPAAPTRSVTPSPQKAATPISEPAKGVKANPPPTREARGFEEPAQEPGAKPYNERTTLMPPPPPREEYPRPHGERSTPPLPLTVKPVEEEGERGPTLVPSAPKPDGFVTREMDPDTIAEALFKAADREERNAEGLAIKHGVSRQALEQGTAPINASKFSESSMVQMRVDNLKGRIPPRFVPYIESAMEVLAKNMKGYEPLAQRMMTERRWTREQEESLGGALSAASDELQRIFKRMYKEEAVRRIKSREELVGLQDPGEVEKQFAHAILGSKHSNTNHETNVFDAFAKGAMFVFLSQQRPRTFMHALGHPEISKPYGCFGGVEGLGVMIGLDLPDPQTVNNMPNPLIGLAFRLYSEVHLSTLSDWLMQVVVKWPKPQTVSRFENMVKSEVDEFQRAVVDAKFSTEMFFQVLGMDDHSKIREEPGLNNLFEEAAKEKTGIPRIYGHADDIFDALEAVVGYMNLLKHDKTVRNFFLDSYLSNYPIGRTGGSFYKMFGMCLFNERDDIERHPEIVQAYKSDIDPRVQFHIKQKLEQLQVRQTLLGVIAQHAAAEGETSAADETDFGDLNGE